MSHSYKTILKKIILKLGFGFKKDRIEACLGEEIPLQLDEKLFEGYIKAEKKNNRKNSFARWSKEDGSEISDSKTIQDDDGNTTTKVNLNARTLSNNITNNSQSRDSHAKQEIRTNGHNSGNPFVHWSINGQRDFSAGIDNYDDDSFKICKNYYLDKNHFFRINKEGNNTHPFQYSAFAVLGENSGYSDNDVKYYLGGGKPLYIIDNQGGGLFPGVGFDQSKPAVYTCLEDAKYQVYVAIVIETGKEAVATIRGGFEVESGGKIRSTSGTNCIPNGSTNSTASALGGVKAKKGDKIKFFVTANSSTNSWRILQTIGNSYTTYIGIYCLG